MKRFPKVDGVVASDHRPSIRRVPVNALAGGMTGLMLLLVGQLASQSHGATLPPGRPFLEQHCIECHDAETKKGDLDLTALKFDLRPPLKVFWPSHAAAREHRQNSRFPFV